MVLVHGLGTNAELWDLPGRGGLAPELWRAGFEVYSLDWSGAAVSLDLLTERIGGALARIRAAAAQRPLFAIGHGIGGTALYEIAAAEPESVAGLVQLSAPLTFDGRTAAFAALLRAPEHLGAASVTWAQLRDLHLLPSTAADGSFERTLLFSAPLAKVRELFYDHVDAPTSRVLLASLAPLAESEAIRPGGLAARLAKHPALPMLVFVAPGDGLAPPWQCDPAVLDLRRDNIERHYLTRANGTAGEYNHLDLLLHPDASREVFPAVIDWLDERLDERLD